MSPQRPAPAHLRELFLAFNRLALQGFGGVLAVAQRELVDRLGWLSKEEFLSMLAVAQVMPGPNVVNLSLMIGDRFFGLRGAFTAMAGMFAVPCVIVLTLAVLSEHMLQFPAMAGALRGMGAVSAGLIVATGLKLLPALKKNVLGGPLSLALAALAFVLMAFLKWPLVWVVFGLGAVGMALAWRQLGRHEAAAKKDVHDAKP